MDNDRLYAVSSRLVDYVRSPSLRHIRDPRNLHKLAREIVESLDRASSIWQKWDLGADVPNGASCCHQKRRSSPITLMRSIGCVAVLRRGAKSGEYPERFSLLSAPLDQRGLPSAVMAFAERFAAGILASDGALMDFLERRPPRLKSRALGAPLQHPGQSPSSDAMRAVMDLDDSYLFIQGPPGTGKTYSAAQIALQLLAKGYQVAVTSNSHKAINNTLAEIETAAAALKFPFRGAKKGRQDEPDTHFDSTNIRTVMTSDDVGREFQLVGGTAFHFCREDQRQQFDYLIVDEAGQVSLGNLVAIGPAARNIVLVGDQMQLAQPVQGVHPGERELSCLEYLLQEKATVPPTGASFSARAAGFIPHSAASYRKRSMMAASRRIATQLPASLSSLLVPIARYSRPA